MSPVNFNQFVEHEAPVVATKARAVAPEYPDNVVEEPGLDIEEPEEFDNETDDFDDEDEEEMEDEEVLDEAEKDDEFLLGSGKFVLKSAEVRPVPVNFGSPLKQSIDEVEDTNAQPDATVVENDEEARELIQSIFAEGEWEIEHLKSVEDRMLQMLQAQKEDQDEDFTDLIRQGLKEERKFMDQVKAKEIKMKQQLENLKRQQGKKIKEMYFNESEMYDKLKQQIEERTLEHEEVIESLFDRGSDLNNKLREKDAHYKRLLGNIQRDHQNTLKKIQYRTHKQLQENLEIHEKQLAAMKDKLKEVNEMWALKMKSVIDKYEGKIDALKTESGDMAEKFGLTQKKIMEDVQKKQVEKNIYFDKAFKEMDARHGKEVERVYKINQKLMTQQQEMHEKSMREIVDRHNQSLEQLRLLVEAQKEAALSAQQELKEKEEEGQVLTEQQLVQEAQHQAVIDELEFKERQIELLEQEAKNQAVQAIKEKEIQEQEIQRLVDGNSANDDDQKEIKDIFDQFAKLYQPVGQVEAQSVPESVEAMSETDPNNDSSDNWKLIVGASVGGFIALVLLLLGMYKLRQRCKSRRSDASGFIVSSQGTSGDIQMDRNARLNMPLTPDEILAIELASEQLDDKKFSSSQHIERIESV